MLEEAAVFNRQHRLHHGGRNLAVGDQPTLGAILVLRQRRDELRLKFVSGQRSAVFRSDALHLAIFRGNGRAIHREVALRAWLDQDGIAMKLVAAQLRIRVIPSAAQRGSNGGRGQLLPRPNLLRSRIDLGDRSKQRPLRQAVRYEPTILKVEIGEDGPAKEHNDQREQENRAHQLRKKRMRSVIEFEFYRHAIESEPLLL